ncbi:MAG: hypothetical protein LBK99_20460 [Opitutaceae bacterium]|jgi:hypothetical protein|nr:hypothetical protein [Opitutaceae bacterium]
MTRIAIFHFHFSFMVAAILAAPVDAAITVRPVVRFSDDVIAQALAQPAPVWHYKYQRRYREIDQTCALHTLALAAWAGQQQPPASADTISEAVAARLRTILAGGTEPECQGGLGGWTHGPFAWTLALARHTPAVWNRLSGDDHARADLLMQALAVAANFNVDDDNNYRCMIDGDINTAKTFNPNHVEGYVAAAMAAGWYFEDSRTEKPDALDVFFEAFDFDSFLEKLRAANFTNIIAAWTHTPETRRVLMEGGPFFPDNPKAGAGRGVRGNPFTYGKHRAGESWAIYARLARRMFAHEVKSGLPVSGREGEFTRILGTDTEGRPLVSPWEGQRGMCYEFLTSQGAKRGSKFRSCARYVWEGWTIDMATAVTLYARGLWPVAGQDDGHDVLSSAVAVGSEDLLFKLKHGYRGFAHGAFNEVDWKGVKGWPWVSAWWTEVLAPAIGGEASEAGVARASRPLTAKPPDRRWYGLPACVPRAAGRRFASSTGIVRKSPCHSGCGRDARATPATPEPVHFLRCALFFSPPPPQCMARSTAA